jgi:hypothetical protein
MAIAAENDVCRCRAWSAAADRCPAARAREEIRRGDMLVVDATPEAIDAFVGALKLEYQGSEKLQADAGVDLGIIEVVVPRDSRIEGRSAQPGPTAQSRHGVTLLGVSRQGKQVPRPRPPGAHRGRRHPACCWAHRTACLPWRRGSVPCRWPKASGQSPSTAAPRWPPACSPAAVAAASFGLISLPIALAAVLLLYVLFEIVPIRQVYDEIEWPVVVLLGSMIPLGAALERSGGTELIATGIVDMSSGLPAAAILTILMIVTMTLSDVINNTATAVIAAPIGVNIATSAGRQSRSVPDGGRGRGLLRVPHAHWPQEQHADPGARRLPLWRLLAHGPAAGDHRHRRSHPHNSGRLATVIRLTGITSRNAKAEPLQARLASEFITEARFLCGDHWAEVSGSRAKSSAM